MGGMQGFAGDEQVRLFPGARCFAEKHGETGALAAGIRLFFAKVI